MAKPYDATLKDLERDDPHAFLTAFDQKPNGKLSLLNVDLSTVTTAGDLVIGLGDPLEEIIQIDFQASAAARKHRDLLAYNALLHAHYDVPVHSIIVLLRPQAKHSNLTGQVKYKPRPKSSKMNFEYDIVRLWKMPAEELLVGSLGTVPLAPLGKSPDSDKGKRIIIEKTVDRLVRDASNENVGKLLTATFVLGGMVLPRELLVQIFQGVHPMRESVTYMAIIEEGREEEAKRLLLLMGEECFGPAAQSIQAKISAIKDIDHLERLAKRLVKVENWQELLEE